MVLKKLIFNCFRKTIVHLCGNSWKNLRLTHFCNLIYVTINHRTKWWDNFLFAQLKWKLEIWKAMKSFVWYGYTDLFCSGNVSTYFLIKVKLNIAGVQEIWVLKIELPDFIMFQTSKNNKKEKNKHQNCSKLLQDCTLKLVIEWVSKISTKLLTFADMPYRSWWYIAVLPNCTNFW